jgi:hypothetical protein
VSELGVRTVATSQTAHVRETPSHASRNSMSRRLLSARRRSSALITKTSILMVKA